MIADEGGAPGRQRARGRVVLAAGLAGSAPGAPTRPTRVAESGPLRLRFPNAPGPALEAVLLNSAGGIACGDALAVEAACVEGARLVLTTTAAEKVYRSDGPTTSLDVSLALAPDADLAWLPQETILFDAARLRRTFRVAMTGSARLTLFEALFLGRAARGETVRTGFLEDRWRLRRDGRLAYADTLRLGGKGEAFAALARRPAVLGGAGALATLLHVAPDAEARLEAMRAIIADAPPCLAAAASAWNGILAVRLLGRDGSELRRTAVAVLEAFRGAPLPRVWRA